MSGHLAKQDIIERARALAPTFAARAADAEQARCLPAQSTQDMLAAGLARVLAPRRFGGYGLGLDTWFEAVREIGKGDGSHGWCASLMIHHPHMVGMFPEPAQQDVWADGPDVVIAAAVQPRAKALRVDGGYRVTGQSPSASGVAHATWTVVGAMADGGPVPEWMFFLIPSRDYAVRDTWFTAGMCATGSNTVVTDGAFVPDTHVLSLAQLRQGTGPGGALHDSPIFRTPFFYYSPLTFAAPMLGAAQGAYDDTRAWARGSEAMPGARPADRTGVQVRMARAAANLDIAELLLRRAALVPHGEEPLSRWLLGRTVRDCARASELVVAASDALLALGGTQGFAGSHPVQRAWRDIHIAATHVTLNGENNFAHFGRTELGLPADPAQPYF